MTYTPPVVGAAAWGNTLNAALEDINTPAEDMRAGRSAAVATQQDTASTAYTDLTTVGPTVSITLVESRTVLVFMKSQMIQVTTTDDVFMSFVASGATTLAASDSRAVRHNGSGTSEAYSAFARVVCNAGTTTFTAKYRTEAAGNARFTNRELAVVVQ